MPDKGLIYHEGHEEKTIGLFVIHDNAFKAVIPAKAGIQTIINTPTQVGQRPKHGFVRYAGLYDKLDSGLRRNDEVANRNRVAYQFQYRVIEKWHQTLRTVKLNSS